jgi:uncharacterized membrane protein
MSIFTTFASLLKSSDVPNVPNATANQVLDAGLNILYLVAGIVGVIVIIIAGITPDAVKKAKNMIVYAVIGLVVIMSAWAVTWFFIGRFQ